VDDQPTVRKLFQQGLSWQEQPEFSQTSILGAQIPSGYKCLQALCHFTVK